MIKNKGAWSAIQYSYIWVLSVTRYFAWTPTARTLRGSTKCALGSCGAASLAVALAAHLGQKQRRMAPGSYRRRSVTGRARSRPGLAFREPSSPPGSSRKLCAAQLFSPAQTRGCWCAQTKAQRLTFVTMLKATCGRVVRAAIVRYTYFLFSTPPYGSASNAKRNASCASRHKTRGRPGAQPVP